MTGAELRALRESWGWSQRRMAAELGISNASVSYMEAGERPVTKRTERTLELIRRERERGGE